MGVSDGGPALREDTTPAQLTRALSPLDSVSDGSEGDYQCGQFEVLA